MKNKLKKKILIMIPTFGRGGAERVASILTRNLIDEFEIEILVKSLSSGKNYDFDGKVIDLNVVFHNSIFLKIFRFIQTYFFIRSLKKRNNYYKSISFLEEMNVLNILTSLSHDDAILCVRSYLSNVFISKSLSDSIFRFIIKKFYNKSKSIVVQSSYVTDDLVKNFGILKNKIKVIPNIFEISKIRNLSSSKDSLNDSFDKLKKFTVFSNLGRLDHLKGQEYLIKVFNKLVNIHPVKLFLIGDGVLKNNLIKMSKSFGLKVFVEDVDTLTKNFDVYFWKPRNNPFNILKSSNIYLHSSSLEGFPNVIVEAMACGLPVLSTDCLSGPRDIISPNSINKASKKESFPEYSEYGILMPVFRDLNKKEFNNSDIIIDLWVSTLEKILSDSNILNEYIKKSISRSNDFDVKKILYKWKKVINDST